MCLFLRETKFAINVRSKFHICGFWGKNGRKVVLFFFFFVFFVEELFSTEDFRLRVLLFGAVLRAFSVRWGLCGAAVGVGVGAGSSFFFILVGFLAFVLVSGFLSNRSEGSVLTTADKTTVLKLQASSAVAKVSRRSRAALSGKPGSGNTKRGSEKKKYVQKDNAKSAARKESKDKSAFIVVPRREDLSAESMHGIEGSISGIPLSSDSGKKKILLLKGKQREIPSATEGTVKQQNVQSGNSPISTPAKQNQRRENSGRLIRSILLNNEARQNQSITGTQQKIQILSSENGKRPPRPFGSRSGLNDQHPNHDTAHVNSEGDSKRALDEKFVKRDPHGLGSGEKTEKRTRNKDRPDRGVWTPLRRSDVSHVGSDHTSSSMAQPTLSNPDSAEGEVKENATSGNRGTTDFSASAGGRGNPSIENGSQRNFARRGASYVVKDDGAVSIGEGKPSKKSVGHSAHEKQVWVQKSSSGS